MGWGGVGWGGVGWGGVGRGGEGWGGVGWGGVGWGGEGWGGVGGGGRLLVIYYIAYLFDSSISVKMSILNKMLKTIRIFLILPAHIFSIVH